MVIHIYTSAIMTYHYHIQVPLPYHSLFIRLPFSLINNLQHAGLLLYHLAHHHPAQKHIDKQLPYEVWMSRDIATTCNFLFKFKDLFTKNTNRNDLGRK